jgi:pyruvate,water dikinase
MTTRRFPDPFAIETPAGADGWEDMYNWYHLFGEERREQDGQRFWFQDRLHHPGALHPYDEIQCECWWQALGAFNTRIFAMPPAYGVDQRVLNGYLYVSPVPAPPEDIAARAEIFGPRACSCCASSTSHRCPIWRTKPSSSSTGARRRATG